MAVSFRSMAKIALAKLTPQRFYLFINARAAARDIASKRRWAPEIEHLPRFVHGGDTVVDVGGNHGLYTYHLSRLVGPAGRVHTFEPIPPNLEILRYTIERHELSNVTVHPKACGEVNRRVRFAVPIQNGVLGLGGARQDGDGLSFECEMVRIDDIIRANVSFLKIDVEGAELFVLRGAEKLLQRCHPAILFEAGGHTADFGYEQQAVFDYLAELGYHFLSGGFSGKALEPRVRFTAAEDYFAFPAIVPVDTKQPRP